MEEYASRQHKSKNIILYNLSESAQDTAKKRQEEDIAGASEVLTSFLET